MWVETSIKKDINFNTAYLKGIALWMIYIVCWYFLYFLLWICGIFLPEKRNVNKILGGKAKKRWQTQLATVTERSNVIQEILNI